MKQKFYISTPIYYPSGKPHIGHAYTTIIADVLARYKRNLDYDVFFITGTDEHGQKIETKAAEAKVTPQQLVDANSKIFKDLWTALGINYDKFIRTTDRDHEATVQKVFTRLIKENELYLGAWSGLYCISCEENYTETQAVKNEDKSYSCTQGHKLILKSEESYFYRMSKHADWLLKYYNDNPDFIFPSNRVKELINNFIATGLEDLSVSRTSFTWGVKLLENKKHVAYVWIDALLNYISGLGYLTNDDSKFQYFWQDDKTEIVHLLSKEITRFHCIYWPIMLNTLNLRQPSKILSHGWIVTKEGKMSKSKGNVLDPFYFIEKYGRDSFRYFLIKELVMTNDSVFSEQLLIDTFNADLANNYGNMISRTIGMLKKYNNNIVPTYAEHPSKMAQELNTIIKNTVQQCLKDLQNYQTDKIMVSIQKLINCANKYIEDLKPWELFKKNQTDEINLMLNQLIKVIEVATYFFQPVLIDGTKAAMQQLAFKKITIEGLNDNNHQAGVNVNQSVPIYERIK